MSGLLWLCSLLWLAGGYFDQLKDFSYLLYFNQLALTHRVQSRFSDTHSRNSPPVQDR